VGGFRVGGNIGPRDFKKKCGVKAAYPRRERKTIGGKRYTVWGRGSGKKRAPGKNLGDVSRGFRKKKEKCGARGGVF